MFRMWTITAIIAALALASGTSADAAEDHATSSLGEQGSRFNDPAGDATGAAPDIVAVTVSEPDAGPLVAISVEFASEPPLRTDMETYTDVVFIDLACDPEAPLMVGIEEHKTDYVFGTHGVTLERDAESGAHLYVDEGASDLYWHVVDVAVEGATVTWTVDRKLLGDPDVLSWVVLVGVEREEGTTEEGAEEEYDTCPDVGQPRGVYTLRKAWR